MNGNTQDGRGFVGYEYKSVTVKRDMTNLYTDCFPSFGWTLESKAPALDWVTSVTLKYRRDRKIVNKMELTRLQRQFESQASEINKLETSKTVGASAVAYVIGILGTAFMAGSVFAVTSGMIPLCIILAVPAFIGWIIPYFCYRCMSAKKAEQVTPLIEQQYDAIYETCEKASALLYGYEKDKGEVSWR